MDMQAQCEWTGGGTAFNPGPGGPGGLSSWCELTESGINYDCDEMCAQHNDDWEECDESSICLWGDMSEECRFTDSNVPGECVNNPDYDPNCCTNPSWCSDPMNWFCLGGQNAYSCLCTDDCQCRVDCCAHPSACDNCQTDCTCGGSTPPGSGTCWHHGVWICQGKPDGPVIT
jgi:hypothetical protein